MPVPELTLAQRHTLREAAVRLQRAFDGTFNTETIARYLDDSLAKLSAYASYPDFISLLAERFARERLTAIAKMEGSLVSDTPSVLFLCVHNAGRSQMAAGWLRTLAGDQIDVFSGGSDPGHEVNAAAIEAMNEVGIDISNEFPKPWTDEIVRAADVVVTMGCGDACPLFPRKRYEDWELEDPAGRDVADVRAIRDEIHEQVRQLLVDLEITVAG